MDEIRLGHTCSVITNIPDIGLTGIIPRDCYKRTSVGLEGDVQQEGSVTCQSNVNPHEVFTDTSLCGSSFIAGCEVEDPKECPYIPNTIICSKESESLASSYDEPPKQRSRKVTRPYSPEVIVRHKRMVDKKKLALQYPSLPCKGLMSSNTQINDTQFSCDLCKSPYIINPTRCRLPYTKAKRKPAARKIIDPVMKKTLVVCNACGLASGRNQMKKGTKAGSVKAHPSEEDKANYRKEAILFAKSLAVSLQEPLLERFYCPAYKCKPCRCLQSYIMGNDESGSEMVCSERALQLLTLLKEAKSLSKQKHLPDDTEHGMNAEQNKSKLPRGAKLRRTQAFEDFVLSQRLYLRNELGLCERACQRILVYSNNFLHKKVKSASNNGSRIENMIGKNVVGALKPIAELANTSCCMDNCVILASTHCKLLESWRKTARLGQRQARRVLAEMLTPTGGTKANCYKFISMVTGCSYTTINLVNEHMKQTQGDREPPEHGLKRRHRDLTAGETQDDPQGESEKEDDPCNWSDLEIPSQEELQAMNSQQALAHLQQQQEKLDRLKKQIADQQLLLEKQQTLLNSRTSPSGDSGTVALRRAVGCSGSEDGTSVLNSPQLLHILTLPTSTSGAAGVPIPRHVMSPPTISVMAASGNFEPLGNIGNISVSLPHNSTSTTTFSNVVIIPESSLDVSSLGTRVYTEQHTESVVSVPAASYEVDISSSPSASQSQTTSSSAYQLFAVMDTSSSTIFHFNNY